MQYVLSTECSLNQTHSGVRKMTFFLYKLWQNVNNDSDTYASAVVCAKNADKAKQISIDTFAKNSAWTTIDNIQCELIGVACNNTTEGIVVSSFNAG